MSKRKKSSSLSVGDISFLESYILKSGKTKKAVAEEIGIPSSTFSDLVLGKNGRIQGRTKRALRSFIVAKKKEVGAGFSLSSGEAVVESLVPKETGGPRIESLRMSVLLSACKVGMDQCISAMTEIVNASFADRKIFRDVLGKENDKLRIITKALSSEDQLRSILRDLGESQIL